ncbi:NAD-dependent protein deacylase sirtuin-5, mitochondrial, partial [Caerostris darwini]
MWVDRLHCSRGFGVASFFRACSWHHCWCFFVDVGHFPCKRVRANWHKIDIATPGAFLANPSQVWEFYSHRRDVVLSKKPNPAHHALAKAEEKLASEGRRLVVITQNIDELHRDAGTKNLLELHGTLLRTRCTKCGDVAENSESYIDPDPEVHDARIPEQVLLKCVKCAGLLRPHVVWFGESLDPDVLMAAQRELDQCDLCLV